jgi:1-acyl-sn-glycerol-3-phosphate acyltransferase
VVTVAGARLSVAGAERLEPGRAWFFACNHQSFGDIPVLFWALPADLRFVAKRELRAVPFLGWYMQAMGMVFVDRGRRRSGAAGVDAAAELLRCGGSVLSFPGGTRRRSDEPQGFKAAALAPALAAGVPVVPVAIHGTGTVLPPGLRLRPARVQVMVGEPIPTAGRGVGAREEVARQVEAAVSAMLAQLAGERDARGAAVVLPVAASGAGPALTADDGRSRQVVV